MIIGRAVQAHWNASCAKGPIHALTGNTYSMNLPQHKRQGQIDESLTFSQASADNRSRTRITVMDGCG